MISEIYRRLLDTVHLSSKQALLYGALFFVISTVVSLGASIFFLVNIPVDYFTADTPKHVQTQHPAIRVTILILKNILGILFILSGLIMAIPGVPGQGLLMMLLGIMLVNFPGKRRLERRFVRLPNVLQAINKLRVRYGKPPLVI